MRQVRSDVVLAPQRKRHTLDTPLPERAPKELVLIYNWDYFKHVFNEVEKFGCEANIFSVTVKVN